MYAGDNTVMFIKVIAVVTCMWDDVIVSYNLFQHVVEVFGLQPLSSGGFKQSGLLENSSLVSILQLHHVPLWQTLNCNSIILCIFDVALQALVNVDKKKELSEVSEKLANLFKGSK